MHVGAGVAEPQVSVVLQQYNVVTLQHTSQSLHPPVNIAEPQVSVVLQQYNVVTL